MKFIFNLMKANTVNSNGVRYTKECLEEMTKHNEVPVYIGTDIAKGKDIGKIIKVIKKGDSIDAIIEIKNRRKYEKYFRM